MAALVLGVMAEERNSSPEAASFAAFAASNFDSASSFWAAFAVLLGLFFAFAIDISFSILNYPAAAYNLISVIEDRRLAGRDRTLRFVKNNAGTRIR